MSATSLRAATWACVSYFTLAMLSLHVLRADYEPRVHFISDYAFSITPAARSGH